jgi:ribulose-phosphate 3-epimerase
MRSARRVVICCVNAIITPLSVSIGSVSDETKGHHTALSTITPHMPIRIAPSILAADFARLGEQIADAEAAGADLFHFDVMDGQFVPNITMGPVVLEGVRRSTKLPLDVHLMIVQPERYIEVFAKAGADSINVHVETCPDLPAVIQQIHNTGCKAGVAINPETPVDYLAHVMHLLDIVLVMTVNPGFGGQAFMMDKLPKITRVAEMVKSANRAITIAIDGGINLQTIGLAAKAGGEVLIAGNAIFRNKAGIAAGSEALRQAAQVE